MPSEHIRAIAIALIRRPADGNVLAMYGHDPLDGRRFYRPAGGGIEYGETSQTAVCREIQEELGAEVEAMRLFQIVENIFTNNGRIGHEIVFIWECRFADPSLYTMDELAIDENGVPMIAHWVDPAALAAQGIHFYPDALAEALATTPTRLDSCAP